MFKKMFFIVAFSGLVLFPLMSSAFTFHHYWVHHPYEEHYVPMIYQHGSHHYHYHYHYHYYYHY